MNEIIYLTELCKFRLKEYIPEQQLQELFSEILENSRGIVIKYKALDLKCYRIELSIELSLYEIFDRIEYLVKEFEDKNIISMKVKYIERRLRK